MPIISLEITKIIDEREMQNINNNNNKTKTKNNKGTKAIAKG